MIYAHLYIPRIPQNLGIQIHTRVYTKNVRIYIYVQYLGNYTRALDFQITWVLDFKSNPSSLYCLYGVTETFLAFAFSPPLGCAQDNSGKHRGLLWTASPALAICKWKLAFRHTQRWPSVPVPASSSKKQRDGQIRGSRGQSKVILGKRRRPILSRLPRPWRRWPVLMTPSGECAQTSACGPPIVQLQRLPEAP